MFLKRTRSKNFTYLSIVKTYRENGKVKHQTLLQLGREDQLKANSSLQRLVDSIERVGGISSAKGEVSLKNFEEQKRQNWGAVKVYRKLWDQFELNEVIESACRSKRRHFDLPATVFTTVLSRLMSPSSKLKIYEHQDEYLGLDEVSLQHFYRSMDYLADGKDEIEHQIFERQKSLFNMQIDIVLYDVTTLYFESTNRDELKDFGYSKDAKFGEVQVVLGLLVDTEGRPIGFDLFPGNTFEGHTLIKALRKLKERFKIRHVVIVADRGINSKLNLYAIKQAGFDYIVGSRLKNMKASIKKDVLDSSQYEALTHNKDGEITLSYRKIDYDNQVHYQQEDGTKKSIILKEKLFCTWSKKRSLKDYHQRQQLVQRAEELITTPSKIKIKRGPRRFISTADDKSPILDQEKINEDAKWDGFYGIQTSSTDLPPQQILDAYHSLWKIEESFRVFKHTMKTRPIFHWTPKRIKGHLVACFIAFLLERTLEILLKKKNIPASTDKIKDALGSLQVSTIMADNSIIYMTSKVSGLGNQILRVLSLPVPKNMSHAPPA